MSDRELRKFRLTYAVSFCFIIAVLALVAFFLIASHLWPLSIFPVLLALFSLRFYSNLWKISDEELRTILVKRGYEPFSFRRH